MENIKMEEFIKGNILDVVSEKYKYDPESLEYLMNIKGQLVNVMKTLDETIEYMTRVKKIQNDRNGVVYPFDEGNDYWTIEDGNVIWSCWDYESEQLHDDNPDQQYFNTEISAINFLKNMKS